MKTFLISFLLLFGSISFAQDIHFGKVEQLMAKQDFAQINNLMDKEIIICILDDEKTYSPKTATERFKAFFQEYPSKGFKMNHQGKSAKGSKYGIGNYQSGDQTYACYFYFKPKDGGDLVLTEVRIEEE